MCVTPVRQPGEGYMHIFLYKPEDREIVDFPDILLFVFILQIPPQ